MPPAELTLLAVRRIIVPNLTGAEHGMLGTSEAAGGCDPGHLPTEALPGLFVGTREPAVRGMSDVTHYGPNEGTSQPAIGASGYRSMPDRS